MLARIGEVGSSFPVHPHMLRHAFGYKLANDGQDTRGSALSRTQEHPARPEVYGAVAGAVQVILGRLNTGCLAHYRGQFRR
jgi:hypothetical protein